MTIPTGPAFSARLGTALAALGVPDHPGTPTGAWLLHLEDSARQVTHGLGLEDLRRTAELACVVCASGATEPHEQEEFARAAQALQAGTGLHDPDTLETATIALAATLDIAHDDPFGYADGFTSPETATILSPLRLALALSQLLIRGLRLASEPEEGHRA